MKVFKATAGDYLIGYFDEKGNRLQYNFKARKWERWGKQ